jgi:hypothetical protein
VGDCATVSVTFTAGALADLPKIRRSITLVATSLNPLGLCPKHEAATKEIPGPCASNYCSVDVNAPCVGCPTSQGMDIDAHEALPPLVAIVESFRVW